MFSINCEGCPAPCCRHIDLVVGMEEFNRGDGVCKNLTVDNNCSIYNERPDICRSSVVKEVMFKEMSDESYRKLVDKYCNILLEDHFKDGRNVRENGRKKK